MARAQSNEHLTLTQRTKWGHRAPGISSNYENGYSKLKDTYSLGTLHKQLFYTFREACTQKPLLAPKVPTLHVWGSEFDAQNHVTMLDIVAHTGNPSARKAQEDPCQRPVSLTAELHADERPGAEECDGLPEDDTWSCLLASTQIHIHTHPFPHTCTPTPKAAVSSRSWWILLPHCRRSERKSTLCTRSLLS